MAKHIRISVEDYDRMTTCVEAYGFDYTSIVSYAMRWARRRGYIVDSIQKQKEYALTKEIRVPCEAWAIDPNSLRAIIHAYLNHHFEKYPNPKPTPQPIVENEPYYVEDVEES